MIDGTPDDPAPMGTEPTRKARKPSWLDDLVFTDAEPIKQTRAPRRLRHAGVTECANCGTAFTSGASKAFCGPRCRQQAKAVRYARAAIAEHGMPLPDEVEYAVRIKLAQALTERGYDTAGRLLTRDQRRAVVDRDKGRCVLCGEPGVEIDHIAGSSDDPANLRLLCSPCHRDITSAHLRPATDADDVAESAALLARINAATPVLACDEPDWITTWRAWVTAHTRPT